MRILCTDILPATCVVSLRNAKFAPRRAVRSELVGHATLRWWYVDKSPPIRETNLGSYQPEPERTAEDYPLLGIDLD
jgi:hypothetical protein